MALTYFDLQWKSGNDHDHFVFVDNFVDIASVRRKNNEDERVGKKKTKIIWEKIKIILCSFPAKIQNFTKIDFIDWVSIKFWGCIKRQNKKEKKRTILSIRNWRKIECEREKEKRFI